MAKFRAGVNKLEIDFLQGRFLGVSKKRLSQSQYPFLGSDATTFKHDKVLLDFTVVRETTHWVDGLVSNVIPVGFGRQEMNNLSLNES